MKKSKGNAECKGVEISKEEAQAYMDYLEKRDPRIQVKVNRHGQKVYRMVPAEELSLEKQFPNLPPVVQTTVICSMFDEYLTMSCSLRALIDALTAKGVVSKEELENGSEAILEEVFDSVK